MCTFRPVSTRTYSASSVNNFAPLVVQSQGRLCAVSHALLNKRLAGDTGRVTKGAWIERSLRLLCSQVLHVTCRHDVNVREEATIPELQIHTVTYAVTLLHVT
jgi:hypothetical protein